MSIQIFQLRLKKMLFLLRYPRLIKALLQHKIFAAVEHDAVLKWRYSTIVDIGANRGQFALACRALLPDAKVISFEPLPKAAEIFNQFFQDDPNVRIYRAAIGPQQSQEVMHISARDDSSSLLPMGSEQVKTFPGTEEVGTIHVDVAPLDYFLKVSDISAPALLKIDVQGYEFEVLTGCESLLNVFEHVYCECSFVELYTGQKLVDSIIDWLHQRGFRLSGVHNMSHDKLGKAIQADFLFERMPRVLPA
ncbi:FkbM family methyltransferase [Polynucleobacter sphagniphilus]|jgi:FkbM family methyltransferase|uniref:FkbM family methyltransferase n=1 Tax=Polynucleobacter sphagniphilus TaxID=1743169 RepID=A0AA43M9N3_9BURK|nr:FkbM family methyltransferase [Polynucleobacter sphagniphilus]MDH6504726.1 FkbM family methyltransferase [Polynucleobacter sphagniphilus]MDH6513460.1 FkbM family methyltransferase [Polynucleobacter sphagniphilus]